MRVHVDLIRARNPHSESGAVAVMVALWAVILIGMAAIAVDLGNAYAVKRKLSVAADAAALASARDVGQIVIDKVSGCTANRLVPETAQVEAETIAQATADLVNSNNDQAARHP